MKSTFLYVAFCFSLTLPWLGSSLHKTSQGRAEKLDKSEVIFLNAEACKIANLNLTNNNQKALKIKDNTCLITKKTKFQVKYEGINKYRLFIGKVNFLITEDNIVNYAINKGVKSSQW
jgi:hypothetical protein